ncbi:MAG: hypothetical protein HY913_04695 [Desulfomonile tiedjei]|nr:hypothetical protein [Desulfomonile tiedjei]
MWERCSALAAVLMILGAPCLCSADEFAGKLERVDRETVTVRGGNNQSLILRVDSDNRIQAAPFLGKSVAVDFLNEQGVFRALRFRSVP